MKLGFGERVRGLREDADLTQTQLGEKVHMTQRKISYIECGRIEPSLEDITLLCGFFHVSADYLLGLEPGLPYPAQGNNVRTYGENGAVNPKTKKS